MSDTDVTRAHVEIETQFTCANIEHLLRKHPHHEHRFRATLAQIFGTRPDPPSAAMRQLNVLLEWFRPRVRELFIQDCEHVDPYSPYPTPLVDAATGQIDAARHDEFPLQMLRPQHTRILLPFCFKTVSWFLVEVVLDAMPAGDEERRAAVKVYTNIQGSVHLKQAHGKTLGEWVLDLLEYASRPPLSPMNAVDWRNGTPMPELFVEQLDHGMAHVGVVMAAGFVADKGSAAALLQADVDLSYQARLACVQLAEQRILCYNFERFDAQLDPADRIVVPKTPYFAAFLMGRYDGTGSPDL